MVEMDFELYLVLETKNTLALSAENQSGALAQPMRS